MKRLFALAGALVLAACTPTQQQLAATDAIAKAPPLDPALERAIAVSIVNAREQRNYFHIQRKVAGARISELVTDKGVFALPDAIRPHYCVQVEIEDPFINQVTTYAVTVRQTAGRTYAVQLRWKPYGDFPACDYTHTGAQYRPFPELQKLLDAQVGAS